MICIIDSAASEFLTLFRRNGNGNELPGLPCCTSVWLSQLPDVYSTLERVCDVLTKRPRLIGEDYLARLRALVEHWAPVSNTGADDTPAPPPPPPPAPNTSMNTNAGGSHNIPAPL
jgi:hypothetical protein